MSNLVTPDSKKSRTRVFSPKHYTTTFDKEISSPHELLPHQKGKIAFKKGEMNNKPLFGLNFHVNEDHPQYEKLVAHIQKLGGSVNNDNTDNTFHVHHKKQSDNNYHSDIVFALAQDRSVDISKYSLTTYKPMVSFSKWRQETLDQLDININFCPTCTYEFWKDDQPKSDNISQFAQELLTKYNQLNKITHYTEDNETQNKRFVYILLDMITDRLRKISETKNILQFSEKYIKNIDNRYGFGKIDIVIGENNTVDLCPYPIYLIVEAKARIQDKHFAQITGELLAYAAAAEYERKRVGDDEALPDLYGILCDGLRIQFFMLSNHGKNIIIDRTEIFTICTVQNNEYGEQEFIPNELTDVVEILFSIANKCYKKRPCKRKQLLSDQLEKDYKDIIEKKDKELLEKDKELLEKDKELLEKDKELLEKNKIIEELTQRLSKQGNKRNNYEEREEDTPNSKVSRFEML
jgi:hypothetical protein